MPNNSPPNRNSSRIIDNVITLKPISKTDHQFLYELLAERDPRANISHIKMPTFQQHVRFVKSKPYSRWYIIKYDDQNAGSIYLTHMNEIGIFLKKEFHGKNIGKKALNLLMQLNPRERYLANVNPRNRKSIRFFKKNGFQLIQYTYEIRKKKHVVQ